MTNTIYATFSDPSMAEKAAGALLDNGVRSEHISIILPQGYQTADQKHESGTDYKDSAKHGISTTTAADAESGAAKGAGWGLAVGVLAGLAAIFVPGVGLVVGGGALAVAIGGAAGATAAGAVAGGVTGYLKDQGLPDETAQNYHETLQGGGATLTVMPTDEKITEMTIVGIITKYSGIYSTHAVRPGYVS